MELVVRTSSASIELLCKALKFAKIEPHDGATILGLL